MFHSQSSANHRTRDLIIRGGSLSVVGWAAPRWSAVFTGLRLLF